MNNSSAIDKHAIVAQIVAQNQQLLELLMMPEPQPAPGPEQTKEGTQLLRANEIAKVLSVSEPEVYRLMKGELPTVHLGRSVRVAKSDLEQYIERRRQYDKRRKAGEFDSYAS